MSIRIPRPIDAARDELQRTWRAYCEALAAYERLEREEGREFAKLFDAPKPPPGAQQ